MTPLIVVAGTGTGIGKTTLATGLVTAWGRRSSAVAGIKPIETGYPSATSDVAALGQASTFHVTRFTPPYLFKDPVSPHLAARREGRAIDVATVVQWVDGIRAQASAVVLELAGGLFTPLTDHLTNATLAHAASATRVLLVAPDRLGVLHDAIATARAASAEGIVIDGIVLSAPDVPDASTGTNAEELTRLAGPPVLATLPRTSPEEIARYAAAILDALGL